MCPRPTFYKVKANRDDAMGSNHPFVQAVEFQIGYSRGTVYGRRIDLKNEVRRFRFDLHRHIITKLYIPSLAVCDGMDQYRSERHSCYLWHIVRRQPSCNDASEKLVHKFKTNSGHCKFDSLGRGIGVWRTQKPVDPIRFQPQRQVPRTICSLYEP